MKNPLKEPPTVKPEFKGLSVGDTVHVVAKEFNADFVGVVTAIEGDYISIYESAVPPNVAHIVSLHKSHSLFKK